MSNNGSTTTFWALINETAIFIPKIQRDYVQYRKSNQINLKNLVKKMIGAITGDADLGLNFIYGYDTQTKINVNAEGEKEISVFVPIDGQQRLTTLFLLHLYVFAQCDCADELSNKLIYDTRNSTDEFIRKLVTAAKGILKKRKEISQTIKKEAWYVSEWDYDNSIKSMLVVLDKINDLFFQINNCEWEKYKCRLTEEAAITFMRMEISTEKGKALYIKMNSRGRQLSPLENFKADLFAFLKNKSFSSFNCKQFKENLDGSWIDFVFREFNEWFGSAPLREKIERVNLFFKELLHYFLTDALLKELSEKQNDNELRDKINRIEATSAFFCEYEDVYNEYEEICQKKGLMEKALERFNGVCNLLVKLGKQNSGGAELLRKIWNDIWEISEKSKQQKNREFDFALSMPQRAYLFALSRMASKQYDISALKEYWRICENLINNAEIDKPEKLTACMGWFENANDLIAEIKKSEYQDTGTIWDGALKKSQVSEERIKHHLKENDEKWEKAILAAEKMQYFKGEISFLLNSCRDASDNYKVEAFERNSSKIQEIFGIEDEIIKENSVLLHRVLLCYEDYSQSIKDDVFNYYRDYERHHNQDLRGLFRGNSELIKTLLDDWSKVYEKNFKEFATEKINAYKNTNPKPSEIKTKDQLRYFLITQGEFFQRIERSYKILARKLNGEYSDFCLMDTLNKSSWLSLDFVFTVRNEAQKEENRIPAEKTDLSKFEFGSSKKKEVFRYNLNDELSNDGLSIEIKYDYKEKKFYKNGSDIKPEEIF